MSQAQRVLPESGFDNPPRRTTLSRLLTPAVLILAPVAASFISWLSLIGWCSAGGCPAGSVMQLRGFLQPASITIPGVTMLFVWYAAVVVLATIGWRMGSGTAANSELHERSSNSAFERRYFFVILGAATIGVGYSFYTIAGATSIIGSLTSQTGNSFTEALPDSAGVPTLRYATILAAPIAVYLWRKRVISIVWMLVAVALLLVNSLIASRLSLLMAIVVYIFIWAAAHRRPTPAGQKSVRPWHVIVGVLILFSLLTALNFVRNGNYYRDAGVTNPVAMNLYQSGAYLAVPAQVSLGVSDAIMRGSFERPGGPVESIYAALPSFVVPAEVNRSKESVSADAYEFTVSSASNFTTNSEFADTYSEFGAWGWLYTLLLFPLAGYIFGRFMAYGPVLAGSAGVIAYCFAEVWRIQLLTQGIVVFLVLLTLVGAFFASASTKTGRARKPALGEGN
ncbi:O-antigen polymerase [Gordonia rubripertincta]|uniref:O-antigen ligase n=1 Tax=Gordonia rubripertincta TaxID=36822 RepID=A0ABT4MXQ5_GORRU|nr:O-antigen polymerase [Gordonia rubripertincta]MCZ4551778.1 O-antigen ligase [Gordonia rubripertincta]